jgi:hypothetical protein
MLSLIAPASSLSYLPSIPTVGARRSRPIVLSEYANPLGQNGLKPLVVPNPAAPGQTSGLSWYMPGEGAIFDPLGLITSPEKFERLRYVEIKHGRISMLAVLGHVAVAAGARWPGYAYDSVPFSQISGSGFKALSQLSIQDIAISFVAIGFLEINVMKEVVKGEFPGDLRNGLFTAGWDEYSEKTKKEKINKELNNGRAAMMGIFALMVHENIGDGNPYVLNEAFGLPSPWS